MSPQRLSHAVDELSVAENIPWQEALSRLLSGPDHSDPNARD